MAVQPDLSEFREISRIQPNQCVVVRRIAEVADDTDRANVTAAVATTIGQPDYVSNLAVVKWFRRRDIRIDDSSVKRHRSGECCCE